MKNVQQIQMIHTALSKEKDKFMAELAKLNQFIESKLSVLKKFIEYQKDYSEGENYSNSRSIPILNKNLASFSNKLKQIIYAEEKEIDKLVALRSSKLKDIAQVDQKMQAMAKFEMQAQSEITRKNEHHEQSRMDDLSALKHTRGNHE